MLLAGDVGGTKTDLAIIDPEKGPRRPLVEAEFSSADYPSLEALVQDFLAQVSSAVTVASFGVAGPVLEDEVDITNLPWVISTQSMCEALGFETVYLLNDVACHAYAVPYLSEDDVFTLAEGDPIEHGAIAVVAPGTGLGESYLTWDGHGYRAHAAEGGHADFCPTTPEQIALLEYLMQRYEHVSWERACSGMAIPDIYEFLKSTGDVSPDPEVDRQIQNAEDPTPIISRAALVENRCPLCRETMRMVVSLIGAEAGNFALKILATGGVYLSGGIPRRIIPALTEFDVVGAFYDRDRMADLMHRIPLRVILNDRAALLGAAWYGLDRLHAEG